MGKWRLSSRLILQKVRFCTSFFFLKDGKYRAAVSYCFIVFDFCIVKGKGALKYMASSIV
jgi:hypothetical protein